MKKLKNKHYYIINNADLTTIDLTKAFRSYKKALNYKNKLQNNEAEIFLYLDNC